MANETDVLYQKRYCYHPCTIIEEILLVAHGGWHNDTIVTVEKKIKHA